MSNNKARLQHLEQHSLLFGRSAYVLRGTEKMQDTESIILCPYPKTLRMSDQVMAKAVHIPLILEDPVYYFGLGLEPSPSFATV